MKHDPLSAAQSEPTCDIEPASLAKLYQRWRQPLRRLFQGRTGSREEAEDATQEVFVRLAVSGKSLAPEEEKPYLSVTARSVSTDGWRKNGRGVGPELVSMESGTEELESLRADEQSSPLEAAAHRQRIARLNDAVAELPERQRQAFLLNRIDGLSHDEVAAAMGISARMVAKHLNRAMAYCQLRVRYASVSQMERLHVHEEASEEAGEKSAAEREDTP